MRDLKQEVLKVPVADRVRKTATKDHTIDITTALLLLRDGQLQQQLLVVSIGVHPWNTPSKCGFRFLVAHLGRPNG